MASPDPPKRSGLSLYANLLDPQSATPGSVSSAPVVYKQPDASKEDEATAKKQVNAAALRFQPTKRPQVASQKQKPKTTTFPKPSSGLTGSSSPSAGLATSSDSVKVTDAPATAPTRSTLADWTNDDEDDVNGFYGEKRERGGRRKKNKKKREAAPIAQDWDDIYDPSRPNNYEEYKHSDERIREIREWKDKLYAHRMKRRRTSEYSSDEEEEDSHRGRTNAAFAPPPTYNFAPPPPPSEDLPVDTSPIARPPPADVDMDETADEVYTRRMRMSQHGQSQPPPPTVDDDARPPPPPPPPEEPPAPLQPLSRPIPAALVAIQNASVSRAPVRYNLPSAPADIPASQEELEHILQQEEKQDDAEQLPDAPPAEADNAPVPRSNRPGQAKFAERMMAKMGWTKGSGLGAKGEGITTALKVQLEKRKQKSDAEGGGFVGPGGKGKIIGGRKKAGTEDGGKFGAMSEVVVLYGMLGGMDIHKEMGEGLVQEIGEECGEKYGNVERVFVHKDSEEESPPVFIKFVQPLSALRAVNALDGRVFNGNTIRAKFWDADRFEQGVYA